MKTNNKIIWGCFCLNTLFALIEWSEYYPESFDKMVNGVKHIGKKAKGMLKKQGDKNNEFKY